MRVRTSKPMSFEVCLRNTGNPGGLSEPYWQEVGYDRRILEPLVTVGDNTVFCEGRVSRHGFRYRCAVKISKTDGVVYEEGIVSR